MMKRLLLAALCTAPAAAQEKTAEVDGIFSFATACDATARRTPRPAPDRTS